MSHRALIADRQPNGRFNVYHSHNGAEDIQLLEELRGSLNVHGQVDFSSLTGRTMPRAAHQISQSQGSKYTVETADTGNIVDPHPVATNIPLEEVLLADDILQFEVLYVVDDGEVNAYWLAWTYPDVIRPWRDHIETEVYDIDSAPTEASELVEYVGESEPDLKINDFGRGWLSDERIREIVRDHHRWIYELQMLTVKKAGEDETDDFSGVPQVIQTPEHLLAFHVDNDQPLVPSSYPFIVPIRIESPPEESSADIEATAARTRFSIGAGLHAAENVSQDDLQQARYEALREIVEVHLSDVPPEFVPGPVGEMIEAIQRRRA